jgi:hypothetical protein
MDQDEVAVPVEEDRVVEAAMQGVLDQYQHLSQHAEERDFVVELEKK